MVYEGRAQIPGGGYFPDPANSRGLGIDLSKSVGPNYACGYHPILVGSSDRVAIDEKIGKIFTAWTTGGDEGLAWAAKALHPAWRDVWDVGPAPHDFGPDVVKQIIFIGDSWNNEGYGVHIEGLAKGDPMRKTRPYILTDLCNYIKRGQKQESGQEEGLNIHVTMVLFGTDSSNARYAYPGSLKNHKACASPNDLNRPDVHEVQTGDALVSTLKSLAKRQYRVKLTY